MGRKEEILQALKDEFTRQTEHDPFGRNYFGMWADVDDGVFTLDGHFNLETLAESISGLFEKETPFEEEYFDYKSRPQPKQSSEREAE